MQQKTIKAETLNEFVEKLMEERESWWQPIGKAKFEQDGIRTTFKQKLIRYSAEPFFTALITIRDYINACDDVEPEAEKYLAYIEEIIKNVLDPVRGGEDG